MKQKLFFNFSWSTVNTLFLVKLNFLFLLLSYVWLYTEKGTILFTPEIMLFIGRSYVFITTLISALLVIELGNGMIRFLRKKFKRSV